MIKFLSISGPLMF